MARHEIIEINGLEYVLGLVWCVLNEDTPQELAKTARHFSSHAAVTLGNPAVCAGYAEKTISPGSLSAAAWLACTLPRDKTCIIVEHLDAERYWFAVVQDGIVYPDTDVLVQGQTMLRQQLQPFIDKPDRIFFGSACETLSGDQTTPQETRLDTLFDSQDRDADTLSHCRLRRVRGGMRSVKRISLLAVVVVSLAGVALFAARKDSPEVLLATEIEARRQMAKTQLRTLRQASLAGPNAQAFHDLVRRALQRMPFYVQDWQLGHVACEPEGCHWTWLSETGALNTLEKRLQQDRGRFEATQDGRTVGLHTIHPQEEDLVLQAKAKHRATLGTRNDFIVLCQQIRKFPGHCTLQHAQPIQFTDSELLNESELPSQGRFTVQTSLAASHSVSAWLTEDWIRPEQLRVDFTDMKDPKWVMEGRYVIQ